MSTPRQLVFGSRPEQWAHLPATELATRLMRLAQQENVYCVVAIQRWLRQIADEVDKEEAVPEPTASQYNTYSKDTSDFPSPLIDLETYDAVWNDDDDVGSEDSTLYDPKTLANMGPFGDVYPYSSGTDDIPWLKRCVDCGYARDLNCLFTADKSRELILCDECLEKKK